MNPQIDKRRPWQIKLYDVIFHADSKAGRIFDVALFILILASVITISLESIASVFYGNESLFLWLELFFTFIFTVEYVLRLLTVKKPWKYATSFYGVIDFLSIAPTYMAFLFPSLHFFLIIRSMRLLRIFRIFKMVHFLEDSSTIVGALWRSRRKILVFFFAVILITIVTGSIMYVIEGKSNPGFHSIPQSVYWAIVTLTTVGYGDVSPITPLGKILASFIMLLGYSIIAVPTGIITSSLTRSPGRTEHPERRRNFYTCGVCGREVTENHANFCSHCGSELERMN